MEMKMVGAIGGVSAVSSLGSVSPVATGLEGGNFAQFLNSGSLMPDISGALQLNANVGGAGLKLAGSQATLASQQSGASNILSEASAIRDYNFGQGKALRDATAAFAKSSFG
jgi:hypothetical protein